jgi:hypothetical protein
MKKHILAVCSVVAISGISLGAQQPPPQPQPLPQTPPTEQTPPAQPTPRPTDPATQPTEPSSRPADPATRQSSPMSDMARTATTVTGCLKTWDSRTMAPATGSGSGAGSASSAVATKPATPGASAQFVLSNIERSGAAARSGASSYLLKTSDSSVSFSQHLNHKVEVTGTLSDAAGGVTPSRSTPSTSPSSGAAPGADRDAPASGRVSADDMKLPTLNVTALKMVSPTCGTGSN